MNYELDSNEVFEIVNLLEQEIKELKRFTKMATTKEARILEQEHIQELEDILQKFKKN